MHKSFWKSMSAVCMFLCSALSLSAKDYTAGFFGIQSGGQVLNTRSIQYGIDYISEHGGGRLVFPAGTYLTGCLHLKSDVTLQLDEGAVLLGSVNPYDYDRQNTAFDHNFSTSLALLLGLHQHNIGITGKGTIDGQGKALAANVGETLRKGLEKGGSIERPDEDRRPMIINFFGCENVVVKNVTLKNSACWVECYNQCKNVLVDSIRVESRAFWNNDGIDIVDCDHFQVSNAYFNCSDDGICLKSLDPEEANQNILVQNNSMTTEASGIKFGTASLGGFKNIRILNNKVFETNRSALALEAVDGAVIQNIEVDGLIGNEVGNAIFIRAGARKGSRKGSVSQVTIRHVAVTLRTEKDPLKAMPGIVIGGMPDQLIDSVYLKDITLKLPGGATQASTKISIGNLADIPEKPASYPEYDMFGPLPAWGVFIRHARNIQVEQLSMIAAQPDFRTAIVVDDVQQVSFKNTTANEGKSKKILYANRATGVVWKR